MLIIDTVPMISKRYMYNSPMQYTISHWDSIKLKRGELRCQK